MNIEDLACGVNRTYQQEGAAKRRVLRLDGKPVVIGWPTTGGDQIGWPTIGGDWMANR